MSGAFTIVEPDLVFPVRTHLPMNRAFVLALVVFALLVLVLVVDRGSRRCVPEDSNEALCSAPPVLDGSFTRRCDQCLRPSCTSSRGTVRSASGPCRVLHQAL